MAGYVTRIDGAGGKLLKGKAMDRFVQHFVAELGQRFSHADAAVQSDAQLRLRELCRQKASPLSVRIVSNLACYPNVIRTLVRFLAHGQALFDRPEESQQTRMSAATCLRHVALDPKAARVLAEEGEALEMLGKVLLQGEEEEIVHKVAACAANCALEHPSSRAKLCEAAGLLQGLGRLLLTDSPRCVASALAALSNLSLDPSLAWRVAKHVHLPRLVMLLLSGSNKSKHREVPPPPSL